MQAGQADELRELEWLRVEIEGLRATLKRLVLAADSDRRSVERDLHDGVHQHLVALAVKLQLAGQAVDSDPAATRTLLREMARDVQQALEELALLGESTYPPTLESGGLGDLLRSAAVRAGIPTSVDVAVRSNCPPEVGMTLYLGWVAMLARGSADSGVKISVREGEDISFETVGNAARSDADLARLRDRVEALGGRLTIGPEPGGGVRVSGTLPLSR
jgi:signal transduction histidine kinase